MLFPFPVFLSVPAFRMEDEKAKHALAPSEDVSA